MKYALYITYAGDRKGTLQSTNIQSIAEWVAVGSPANWFSHGGIDKIEICEYSYLTGKGRSIFMMRNEGQQDA